MAKLNALSMSELIKGLKDGQSFSRTRRVAVDDEEANTLNAVVAKLRNTLNQSVARVREATGTNFRVETGVALTDDKKAFLATVAVTRMDGELGNDEDFI